LKPQVTENKNNSSNEKYSQNEKPAKPKIAENIRNSNTQKHREKLVEIAGRKKGKK